METVELFGLTVALTELLKEALKWEGSKARLLGTAIGFALGVASRLTTALPVDPRGWFDAIVFGLGLGLASVGLYKVTTALAGRAKTDIVQLLVAKNKDGDIDVQDVEVE